MNLLAERQSKISSKNIHVLQRMQFTLLWHSLLTPSPVDIRRTPYEYLQLYSLALRTGEMSYAMLEAYT